MYSHPALCQFRVILYHGFHYSGIVVNLYHFYCFHPITVLRYFPYLQKSFNSHKSILTYAFVDVVAESSLPIRSRHSLPKHIAVSYS